MSDELETALAESAARGDLESFGELCRRYYAPMVAVAYSVLADQHLAQDAAQEAFAKALVALPRLREPQRFAFWLARICRNVAMDMLRKKAPCCSDDLGHVPDRRRESENDGAVRRAMAKLPAAARELLVLKYYDNLPCEQIASVLDTTNGSVRGRLLRAKRKLARLLIREGLEGGLP